MSFGLSNSCAAITGLRKHVKKLLLSHFYIRIYTYDHISKSANLTLGWRLTQIFCVSSIDSFLLVLPLLEDSTMNHKSYQHYHTTRLYALTKCLDFLKLMCIQCQNYFSPTCRSPINYWQFIISNILQIYKHTQIPSAHFCNSLCLSSWDHREHRFLSVI